MIENMINLTLFTDPWWVNLFLLVPLAVFLLFRKNRLALTKNQLIISAIFGLAFGFIEATVVIYLRSALGLLPGYPGSLADVSKQSLNIYQQAQVLNSLPKILYTVELLREVATILILMCLALLTASKLKERLAIFLWVFAAWDIFYYLSLWLTVRWPYSLATADVLFLIPTYWLAPVWLPIVVSSLTMSVIVLLNVRNRASKV